jgi:hypothetical protein
MKAIFTERLKEQFGNIGVGATFIVGPDSKVVCVKTARAFDESYNAFDLVNNVRLEMSAGDPVFLVDCELRVKREV